jgi:hypothetical protein
MYPAQTMDWRHLGCLCCVCWLCHHWCGQSGDAVLLMLWVVVGSHQEIVPLLFLGAQT